MINLAIPAESTRHYINTGKWDSLLKQVTRGDFVVIEFGHNDEYGITHVNNELVYTLASTGDETRRAGNEDIHSYGWYLRRMISDVRNVGGVPILSGRTPANDWNGEFILTEYPFVRWTEDVAKAMGVEFLDHTRFSTRVFQSIGREVSKAYYASGDPIHNNALGARCELNVLVLLLTCLVLSADWELAVNAETFIQAARCAKSVLTKHLTKMGEAVRPDC